TAMVDAAGRQLLADLFARLAAEEGLAVVHVTHRAEEAARAGVALFLDHGRLATGRPLPPGRPLPAARTPLDGASGSSAVGAPPSSGLAVVELRGVGHIYSPRSPWSHRALT